MQGAYQIIYALEKAGFPTYVVGGAVRDTLLGITPKDVDIVSKAHPDEVIAIAKENNLQCTNLVGKAFGVVIIKIDSKEYEVATFRSEKYGEDSHRPESIEYAETLAEDVKRRDFTMNGLAMDSYGNIIDYVNGKSDIKRKIVRTIGEPEERFTEDALRLFRACRFMGKLGFDIDKKTQDAMPKAFHRVEGLSLERVKIELEKLLVSKYPAKGLDLMVRSRLAEQNCKVVESGVDKTVAILPELYHLVGLEQEFKYHSYDAWMHTLVALQASRADLTIRWATLLHDVAKGMPKIRAIINGRITDRGHDAKGAEMTEEILSRLGYNKKFVNRVKWLVLNHMKYHYYVANEEANIKKWIRKETRSNLFRSIAELKEAFNQLNELCCADIIGCGKECSSIDGTKVFGDYIQELCSQTAVNSKDLNYTPQLITVCGDKTRYVLPQLLKKVQDGQVDNTPEALMEAAKRWLKRNSEQNDVEINDRGK